MRSGVSCWNSERSRRVSTDRYKYSAGRKSDDWFQSLRYTLASWLFPRVNASISVLSSGWAFRSSGGWALVTWSLEYCRRLLFYARSGGTMWCCCVLPTCTNVRTLKPAVASSNQPLKKKPLISKFEKKPLIYYIS